MRVLVEQALIAAKFASTVDVTVLQAVMYFVLVLRKTGEARSAGSLVAIIVHLAQCLRLHKDGAGIYDLTPFQREIRRRLFWCIVVLDHRSAEDLATDPMIPEYMWDTPLPLNINDDDFSESSPVMPEPRDGMTEMTFSLIRVHTLQTSVRIRRLASEEPGQTIETLDQLCEDMWRETHEMLRKVFCRPKSQPRAGLGSRVDDVLHHLQNEADGPMFILLTRRRAYHDGVDATPIHGAPCLSDSRHGTKSLGQP